MLLGRDRELERILGRLDRAAAGAGSALIVEGDAGIGKTSLLAEARERAVARGFAVLAGCGRELEREFGFGVVRQLLERVEGSGGAARLAAPTLGRAPAGVGPAPPDAAFAAMHGLYWLVADRAVRQPLLLLVDDAHWADAPSLRFLAYLAARIDGLAVTLLAAARPPEAASDPALLTALATDPAAEVLRPQPLDAAEVNRLTRERLAAPAVADEFVAAVVHATGGAPLLVVELLAAIREDGLAPTAAAAGRVASFGPSEIVRRLLTRLAGLPDGAVPLARAVAVLGGRARGGDAAALAGLDADRVVAIADALASAGVLGRGAALEVAHPVIREALYADIPGAAREDMHQRAARVLGARHAPPEEIAAHLLLTPGRTDPASARALSAAATEALTRGAPDVAAAYLRRAIGEPPPAELEGPLLAELGIAAALAGSPDAASRLDAALARVADPRRRAQVALERGRLALFTGHPDSARSVLNDALRELGDGDRELTLRIEAQLVSTSSLSEAPARLRNGQVSRSPATPGERALLSTLAFSQAKRAEPVDRAVTLAERALHATPVEGDGSAQLIDAAAVLVVANRYADACATFEPMIAAERARGNVSF